MDVRFNVLVAEDYTNTSNLADPNINILTDIRKLTDEVIEFSNILIVLEDVLLNSSFLLSLPIYQEIYEFKLIFVSQRDELLSMMEPHGEVYKTNPDLLNYEALKAIHFKDETTYENLIFALRNSLSEGSSIDSEKEISLLKARVKSLEQDNSKLSQELKDALISKAVERDSRILIESKYQNLLNSVITNEISLNQVEHILSRDTYEMINLSKYPKCPRILYIKEYQEINFKHSLIRTLLGAVRFTLRKPVKVLMLADSSYSVKAQYVPEYYKRIYSRWSKSDVYGNDYILKIGDYTSILNELLSNVVGLDTLIIVDCNSHSGSVVDNPLLSLALAKNAEITTQLGVPKDIIVTNNPEDELNWPYFENYKNLTEETRALFLISRPLIKRFLSKWGE